MNNLFQNLLEKESQKQLTLSELQEAEALIGENKLFREHSWTAYSETTSIFYSYREGQILPIMNGDKVKCLTT